MLLTHFQPVAGYWVVKIAFCIYGSKLGIFSVTPRTFFVQRFHIDTPEAVFSYLPYDFGLQLFFKHKFSRAYKISFAKRLHYAKRDGMIVKFSLKYPRQVLVSTLRNKERILNPNSHHRRILHGSLSSDTRRELEHEYLWRRRSREV